jgi:N-acetylglutamate synthase-like GNAT family acetyltransferase
VVPESGGSGIGSALLATVCAHARAAGLRAVTLTTFRDVPWNAPFCARRGFRVLPEDEWTPGLAALVAREEELGLPRGMRVVMCRPEPRLGSEGDGES